MKLGLLVSCVLVAGGCDGLFHLVEVPSFDDGGSEELDGDTDGPPVDVNAAGCATIPLFAGSGTVIHSGLQSSAIAADESFALIVNSGNIFQIAIPENTPTAIPAQVNAWTHPALVPASNRFYAFNTTNTQVYQWVAQGASWGTSATVPTLGTTSKAGAVGLVPGTSELRMPLLEGTEMRERASQGGNDWSMFAPFTRGITALTGLSTGSVRDFALTPDASTLVFLVSGSGMDGVWYIRRDNYDLSNNFSTSTATGFGQILASTETLATPYLSASCHLYVVVNQVLYRFDP